MPTTSFFFLLAFLLFFHFICQPLRILLWLQVETAWLFSDPTLNRIVNATHPPCLIDWFSNGSILADSGRFYVSFHLIVVVSVVIYSDIIFLILTLRRNVDRQWKIREIQAKKSKWPKELLQVGTKRIIWNRSTNRERVSSLVDREVFKSAVESNKSVEDRQLWRESAWPQ